MKVVNHLVYYQTVVIFWCICLNFLLELCKIDLLEICYYVVHSDSVVRNFGIY